MSVTSERILSIASVPSRMTALDWLSLVSNVLGILGFFVSVLTYLKVKSLKDGFRKVETNKHLEEQIKNYLAQLKSMAADKSTLTKALADECRSIIRLVRDMVVSPLPWKDLPIKRNLRVLTRDLKSAKISRSNIVTSLQLVLHEISSR